MSDHDFQTALIEALCRMATPDQRKQLANTWFSMGHVVSAFVKIQDSEFETVMFFFKLIQVYRVRISF